MPKNDDLSFKSPLRPEQRDHEACQELQTIDHPAADYPIPRRKPLRMKFSVGTSVYDTLSMKGESHGREFAEKATRLVKVELKRADLTYEELARRLTKMGLPETEDSVKRKLSRGSFSVAFLLAVMTAVGRQTLNLDVV